MFAPIANAQDQNPGQLAGHGFGYALSTQERCAGHPVRSGAEEELLQARFVKVVSRETASAPDEVRAGMLRGAMQASFAKKPTKKDCKEAEKIVNAAKKFS